MGGGDISPCLPSHYYKAGWHDFMPKDVPGGCKIPHICVLEIDDMEEEPKIVGYSRDKKGKVIGHHLKDVSNTLHTGGGTTEQYVAEPLVSVHPLSHALEFRGAENFKDISPALRATDNKAPYVVAEPVTCVARKRGEQHNLEMGGVIANALTTVNTDCMVVESSVLTPKRTEKAKALRRQGIETFAHREYEARKDGVSNTITTVQKDNMVAEVEKAAEDLKELAQASRSCNVEVTIGADGHLRPYNADTKAKNGISEYCTDYDGAVGSTNVAARPNNVFGESTKYRIRKLTPRECFRLMDVDDANIDKIQAAGISKSQMYKLAGNSIVCNVLFYIFRNLFIDEFKTPQSKGEQQLTLDFQ